MGLALKEKREACESFSFSKVLILAVLFINSSKMFFYLLSFLVFFFVNIPNPANAALSDQSPDEATEMKDSWNSLSSIWDASVFGVSDDKGEAEPSPEESHEHKEVPEEESLHGQELLNELEAKIQVKRTFVDTLRSELINKEWTLQQYRDGESSEKKIYAPTVNAPETPNPAPPLADLFNANPPDSGSLHSAAATEGLPPSSHHSPMPSAVTALPATAIQTLFANEEKLNVVVGDQMSAETKAQVEKLQSEIAILKTSLKQEVENLKALEAQQNGIIQAKEQKLQAQLEMERKNLENKAKQVAERARQEQELGEGIEREKQEKRKEQEKREKIEREKHEQREKVERARQEQERRERIKREEHERKQAEMLDREKCERETREQKEKTEREARELQERVEREAQTRLFERQEQELKRSEQKQLAKAEENRSTVIKLDHRPFEEFPREDGAPLKPPRETDKTRGGISGKWILLAVLVIIGGVGGGITWFILSSRSSDDEDPDLEEGESEEEGISVGIDHQSRDADLEDHPIEAPHHRSEDSDLEVGFSEKFTIGKKSN